MPKLNWIDLPSASVVAKEIHRRFLAGETVPQAADQMRDILAKRYGMPPWAASAILYAVGNAVVSNNYSTDLNG